MQPCHNCNKYTKENGEMCKGIECNQCCDLQEKKIFILILIHQIMHFQMIILKE